MRIVHLTPHLGGGVGKALSDLTVQRHSQNTGCHHTIATFEKTEKSYYSDRITNSGVDVRVQPDNKELYSLIDNADIVQLEWWNHPATLKALCQQKLPHMRLLVWSHISGLHTPTIPCKLIQQSNRFLFTSACSFQAETVKKLPLRYRHKLAVVNSCGGFEEVSSRDVSGAEKLAVGYVGSLNFSKLHPDFINFIKDVSLSDFRVKVAGDINNKKVLERQCIQAGRPDLLEFVGYVDDVPALLSCLDVFAYILNPTHYGTTENALLEAMAAGVVPIVLDNPAERCIVEHLQTGLVVRDQSEFAPSIQWLSENIKERQRMAANASRRVRKRYSANNLISSFKHQYHIVRTTEKSAIDFTGIFGKTPSDWFLSCQENPDLFLTNGDCILETDPYRRYGLCETTKGSVYHFLNYFKNDPTLKKWGEQLYASCFNNEP